MTIQYIKRQASKLDANSRARLARYLLSSLDNLNETENEKLWAEEALKRHDDLLKGRAKSRSADVVFKNARAHLK
jgi:Putative addiction module component